MPPAGRVVVVPGAACAVQGKVGVGRRGEGVEGVEEREEMG